MEINKLAGFVLALLFIGMLLGVGVLTLDKYARAVRTTTTVISTGRNMTAAGTVDYSQSYCLAVSSVANSTTSFTLATYNVKFSDADNCVVSYDAISGCGPEAGAYCNITYTYGAETKSTTAATDTNSAITPIASTWLPLIVTVAILAIIMTIVIGSFAFGRRE